LEFRDEVIRQGRVKHDPRANTTKVDSYKLSLLKMYPTEGHVPSFMPMQAGRSLRAILPLGSTLFAWNKSIREKIRREKPFSVG
jgi:hypothetical protein